MAKEYENPKITIDEVQRLLRFMAKGYKVPKIIKDVVFKVAKEEIEGKGKGIIIKRDPNVERERMQFVLVKVREEDSNVVQIFPSSVKGFNADFDGDSLKCKVLLNIESVEKEINIEDVVNEPYIKFKNETIKQNGVKITKYDVDKNVNLKLKSINKDTGSISLNKVTEYSKHENLEMYKIEDRKKRFETFWSSSDHSLLVYNPKEDIIEKVTPNDLINRKEERLYFIKEN
jgi:hypothetical protein